MRPVMVYTMLTMSILNLIDGGGSSAAGPQLPSAPAPPSIGAVKLESTRVMTSVNKSELIDSKSAIRRVSIGNPEMIEVIAVSGRELVVHAKAAGETTLIVWTVEGRKPFRVVVMPLSARSPDLLPMTRPLH